MRETESDRKTQEKSSGEKDETCLRYNQTLAREGKG